MSRIPKCFSPSLILLPNLVELMFVLISDPVEVEKRRRGDERIQNKTSHCPPGCVTDYSLNCSCIFCASARSCEVLKNCFFLPRGETAEKLGVWGPGPGIRHNWISWLTPSSPDSPAPLANDSVKTLQPLDLICSDPGRGSHDDSFTPVWAVTCQSSRDGEREGRHELEGCRSLRRSWWPMCRCRDSPALAPGVRGCRQ